MTGPISPTPQQPHYFYSQIGKPDEPIPQELQDHVNAIIDQLSKIQAEALSRQPNIQDLVDSFNAFDQSTSHFFTALSHNSNMAFQKNVKDKFDSVFHHFLEEVDEIHLPEEPDHTQQMDSLRDILSTYDPQKLSDFLTNLSSTPQGMDTLHDLGNRLGTFIEEIQTEFPSG